MIAAPPANFEALEAQARTLLAVFIAAGYEAVAPEVIQPAGVFLDVVGEALRGRTYVFTDLDGKELCLRPDLTVPTCRLYLQRHPAADSEAYYSYNGPAFRFQPASADAAHPREFRQAGIEAFGDKDAGEADARTLVLVLRALQQAGLPGWKLRIGDVALFDALLRSADIPERWRRRLRHQFLRPEAFRAELKRLSTNPARSAAAFPRALIEALDPNDPEKAELLVTEHLEQGGIELIGMRSAAEIAEGLLAIAADAKAPPLKPENGGADRSLCADEDSGAAGAGGVAQAGRQGERGIQRGARRLRAARHAARRERHRHGRCGVLRRVRAQRRLLHGLRLRSGGRCRSAPPALLVAAAATTAC